MKFLIVSMLIVWSSLAVSDDIDLYIKNSTTTVQRPNVLVILDNSGSMGNVNSNGSKANEARKIIIDLINDNPEVDFALQIFNNNNISGRNGGRIISGFNDLSILANKTALLDLLDEDTDSTNLNFEVLQESHTPLCEALYETYRYLSGGAVFYGIQNTNNPKSITLSGNYDSPFSGTLCNKEITIIYITDGEATKDNNADGLVKTLTDATNSDKYDGSFLGVLGSWMGTRNWLTLNGVDDHLKTNSAINDTLIEDVIASIKIHTVGFGSITADTDAVNLLKLAARDGVEAIPRDGYHGSPAGGRYHAASTAEALKTALQTVVLEVLDNSSLTSASVSANSFDRTQTLDSVYYGMFEPSTAARWQGNLKKYKIVNGAQVDSNSAPAINSAGEFDKDAQSFWSAGVDGNDVAEGGVAEMLRATATADRELYTDIKGTGSLTEFSETEINTKYTTNLLKAGAFGIDGVDANNDDIIQENEVDVSEISNHIKWAMGEDVDNSDDDTSTTVRTDVFGDPLHSKPIVINYASGNPRIVVGTNSGVLHMFEDEGNTVKENWAYLPSEFFKNIKPLRENAIAIDNKIYGLDGEISLYIKESDGNGRVDAGDKAWLFFGLRRGGSSYYALDITDPADPKLMWNKDNTGDFSELGQTWSKPEVVRSAYNTDTDKLVVIFGGGYDTQKDATGPNVNNDNKGSALYIVHPTTGALIKKIPTGAKNGIASSVATLDSDNDGLVDRLYTGDTGGNVWRIDMPDDTLAHTSIIKLASLGGVTNPDDLRFFNPPSIVRTYITETINAGTVSVPRVVKQEVPYDAILLGSGDRATPTAIDTNDRFFMIKDKYIATQRLDTLSPAIPAITLSDLYDYTDDPFINYPELTTAQEAKLLDASLKLGWHFDLQLPGEKSTAEAIVINNVVYFTSYEPASIPSACSVTPGNGWLYAVDLGLGIKKYDWDTEPDSREKRIKHIGSQFVGTATLISTPVTDIVTGKTSLQGDIIVSKEIIPVGFTLQTMRTSLTIQEN